VIALSVDDAESHRNWIKDIVETQKVNEVSYPIVADADRKVAKLYGMLHPNAEDTNAGKV
jgi:alkyl hydroperoxide reductase subunit AhpC